MPLLRVRSQLTSRVPPNSEQSNGPAPPAKVRTVRSKVLHNISAPHHSTPASL